MSENKHCKPCLREQGRNILGAATTRSIALGIENTERLKEKKQVLATASEAGQQSGAFSFTFGVRRVCKSTTHYYTSPF